MSRVFEQPLFHGTIASIERIDVSRGNARKDFGRGFYMALSLKTLEYSAVCVQRRANLPS